jgi:glutamate-5-semialdehyde dehydrogenase
MSTRMTVRDAALQAKRASYQLQGLTEESKNKALQALITLLKKEKKEIFEANKRDLQSAEKEKLASPLAKRLVFDEAKIEEACSGLESLAALPDPVGKTISATELDKGLELYKVTCPIGVIGVIFESRPDALLQIGSLALKSGNAVLLKGGHEARETNNALARLLASAAGECGFPKGWLHLLEDRSDVVEMLALNESIDLIIPRGSNQFVRYIMDNTSIPVLGHAEGICLLYIDSAADPAMAINLTIDGKCQYVAVCNALETILIHVKIAPILLPKLKNALDEKGVEIRGCEKTRRYIECVAANEADWRTEYLDYIVSVKVVENTDEAIGHINTYGSHHTDAIVTSDKTAARRFLDLVDSSSVIWNASTRFSDGYRYGLGAELGISTNKIHARGPVGLEGLLIYKWKLIGSGQIVADYTGKNARKFLHTTLHKPFSL